MKNHKFKPSQVITTPRHHCGTRFLPSGVYIWVKMTLVNEKVTSHGKSGKPSGLGCWYQSRSQSGEAELRVLGCTGPPHNPALRDAGALHRCSATHLLRGSGGPGAGRSGPSVRAAAAASLQEDRGQFPKTKTQSLAPADSPHHGRAPQTPSSLLLLLDLLK